MKNLPPNGDSKPTLRLADCWAKTDAVGRPALGVHDHCFQVGAVGREIISRLAQPLGSRLPQGAAFLIAAHDLGKISPGFLLQCGFWKNQWQSALGLSAGQSYENRHAWISQKCLAGLLPQAPLSLLAVGGHHGRYLCQQATPATFRPVLIGDVIFEDLRQELIALLEKEFGPPPGADPITKGARLHWFTGLMIFSDWIGSNTTWFGAEVDSSSVAGANTRYARAATQALDEIGWARHTVRSGNSFADLFQLETPNALQKTLFEAADAPGLYLVEAPMGGGKTEAALFAAQRRWTEGSERGLYFALPTQLTSNRIHQRVEAFLTRTVEDWSTVAVVHGNGWLEKNRIQPLLPPTMDCAEDGTGPIQPGNQWFSDSRRALLAPFGVGTIDQALMSVLPVKFSALRLFALGGKVVIIDEVHSYDAYTSALVDRAVKWLLELHCTVIILSATLTSARRRSLVEAAGATEAADSTSRAYPLITKVPTDSAQVEVIEIPQATPQEKVIHLETSRDLSWMEQAAQAAEGGACVLVLRNTVALAQETFRALKEKCRDTDIQFGCIHSRFTQADRSINETEWMEKLGKDQSKRPTRGAILVGTQVLEQSVDIDADFLITDTAPTDLILQRLGRLHRHPRPRPAGFDQPRCLLLLPVVDWQAEVKAIQESLTPHRFVYPPFHLYLAEKIWASKNSIRIPGEIREVLEESATVPGDLPSGADTLLQEYLREVKKRTETALRRGPFTESPVEDIEGSQTRWIEQQSAHLILLREPPISSAGKITLVFGEGIEHVLTPGVFDFVLARLLHLQAIRLSRYLIQGALRFQPSWLTQHFQGAVLASVNALNQVELFSGHEKLACQMTYHPATGLAHARNQAIPLPPDEEEIDWF